DAIAGELRTRIRQVVPFRDGGWSTSGESLGEYAIAHWRLLRRTGFKACSHLDDFYQGLFWTARSARGFAPSTDPLGDALGDLDWLAGWNQFQQLASPRQMGMTAESYMATLVELPQKLDRILSLGTGEAAPLPSSATSEEHPRPKDRSVVVLCLGLAMAALVLLQGPLHQLTTALGWGARFSEGLLAGLFLALGALLLSRVRRQP
ncbi:MAG: hypothetical protein AAF657_11895, partial [Acidobacteriota bacterium]